MSLSVPNPSINLLTTQTATVSNPTIGSGLNAGSVFNGRGNDFLDPDTIGGKVDNFSGSIRPVISNTLTGQLVNPAPFGKNPDFSRILSTTNSTLRGVMSQNFGANINFQVPIVNHPFIQAVPDLGVNPDPTKIVLSSLFFSQNVQPMQTLWDPRNFNPLQWHNPNSSNILLGTLGAQSAVLGGAGLQFPAYNPFPTQAAVNFPFNPFGSGQLSIPAYSPLLSMGQMGLSSNPLGGLNLGFPGSSNLMANMGGLTSPSIINNIGLQANVFPIFTQPFSVAASQPVQGYGADVELVSMIYEFTGLMSEAMRAFAGTNTNAPAPVVLA